MRLWIPIALVAVALGATYALLRTEPAAGGTGPSSSLPSGDPARAPLDLARGEPASSSRASVPGADAGAKPEAKDPSAKDPSAEASAEPLVPDPVFVGGVTTDPAPSASKSALDRQFETKYAAFSQAERVQALAFLRTTIEAQQAGTEKDAAGAIGSLKDEMAWLQDHLEP